MHPSRSPSPLPVAGQTALPALQMGDCAGTDSHGWTRSQLRAAFPSSLLQPSAFGLFQVYGRRPASCAVLNSQFRTI